MDKKTGFKAGRDPLCVGDVVSVYGGNMGFMKVVEKRDGFHMVNCSSDGVERSNGEGRPFKLAHNLDGHYQVVDPDCPMCDTVVRIYCNNCKEVVIGKMDLEDGAVEINAECAWCHVNEDGNIDAQCKLCEADPCRKPSNFEAMEYFKEQLENWPYPLVTRLGILEFNTKEEVDQWFEQQEMMRESFKHYFKDEEQA